MNKVGMNFAAIIIIMDLITSLIASLCLHLQTVVLQAMSMCLISTTGSISDSSHNQRLNSPSIMQFTWLVIAWPKPTLEYGSYVVKFSLLSETVKLSLSCCFCVLRVLLCWIVYCTIFCSVYKVN